MLKLALSSLEALGLQDVDVNVGDKRLFTTYLERQNLPVWHRRRLMAAFGDPAALGHYLLVMRGMDFDEPQEPSSLNKALEGLSDEQVRRVAKELVAASAAGGLGGRSADEIVDRLLMRRDASVFSDDVQFKGERLLSLLEITGPIDKCLSPLKRIAGGAEFDRRVDVFKARLEHLRAAGLDLESIHFDASFGRPLDYYTGFEFEIYHKPTGNRLIGGGRYDHLCERLGSPRQINAIGFSIWLDQLEALL